MICELIPPPFFWPMIHTYCNFTTHARHTLQKKGSSFARGGPEPKFENSGFWISNANISINFTSFNKLFMADMYQMWCSILGGAIVRAHLTRAYIQFQAFLKENMERLTWTPPWISWFLKLVQLQSWNFKILTKIEICDHWFVENTIVGSLKDFFGKIQKIFPGGQQIYSGKSRVNFTRDFPL